MEPVTTPIALPAPATVPLRLCRKARRTGDQRRLVSILFGDIVGSTQIAADLGNRKWARLLARHDRIVDGQLARFSGTLIDRAGDGFLATFDRPGIAICCGLSTLQRLRRIGVQIRLGLHAGECSVDNDRLSGVSVNLGSRIAQLAEPAELLVSGTVKDLLIGERYCFAERGCKALAGVPGEWPVFAASRSPA